MSKFDGPICKSSGKISQQILESVPGCDPSLRQIVEKAMGFEVGFEQAVGSSSVSGGSKCEGKHTSKDLDLMSHVGIASENEKENSSQVLHSSLQTVFNCCARRKLLVLDVNGLLVDIVSPSPKGCKADTKILRRAVFNRPYCSEFLKFCFDRFDVAIWSSRSKKVLDRVVDYLMGDTKHRLLFCWDLSHCTATRIKTLEDRHKALGFKELRKIWEKTNEPNLPWEKGYYNESNTLLVDDSPYKALINPPHTSIFPYSYKFQDKTDNSLGVGGDIRDYLELLAAAENVQMYVEQHPFGQNPITESSPSWGYYLSAMRTASSHSPLNMGLLSSGKLDDHFHT